MFLGKTFKCSSKRISSYSQALHASVKYFKKTDNGNTLNCNFKHYIAVIGVPFLVFEIRININKPFTNGNGIVILYIGEPNVQQTELLKKQSHTRN